MESQSMTTDTIRCIVIMTDEDENMVPHFVELHDAIAG
jgi:hypothetical protein